MGIREYIIATLLVLCIGNYACWTIAANSRDKAQDKLLTLKAEHAKDIAEANTETALIAIARDQHAAEVSALARLATDTKAAQAQQATQDRRERIRYVTRTIAVPANCPVSLPASVRQDLDQARSETITAGRELRAGLHRGSTTTAGQLATGWPGVGQRSAGHPDPGAHAESWRTPVPVRTAG